MAYLTATFEQLLSMALTALPVMAVVLAVRWLLKKAPKKYAYLLWLVVAFRLVCPAALESPVGIIQTEEAGRQLSKMTDTYVGDTLTTFRTPQNQEAYEKAVESGREPVYAGEPGGYYVVTAPDGISEPPTVENTWLPVLSLVWLAGIAVMAGYFAFSTLRLRRQVSTAVRREDNIWECDSIPTPFVLGLLRPRIYIPFRMTDSERTYILAHERYHIRCGDHWAKLLALLILAVYWWNPAVWLCWVLFCRDMEMRCDEAVLARLGDGVKREYSLSLISFALDRRAPMALAFGEHDAAKRVKNVLRWKKAKPAVVLLAVAAVIVVAVVCGTNAKVSSWVRAEKEPSEDGGVRFTWNLEEPIKAWAIYEDIYEEGRLVYSKPRIMDTFRDDGGVSDRRETISLKVMPTYATAEEGFSGTLQCSYDGTGHWELELPKETYTGMGSTVREGHEDTMFQKQTLTANGSALLYSVVLSTESEGGVTLYHRDKPLSQCNDTVVQYRLVTSTEGMDAFVDTPLDLAQTLFDLRVTKLEDPEDPGAPDAIRRLLDAMGASEFGPYELEYYDARVQRYSLAQYTGDHWPGGEADPPPYQETGLTVHFTGIQTDELSAARSKLAWLLLALVPELDEVTIASARKYSTINYYDYSDDEDSDGLWYAEELGYESLEELGQSAKGIRALLAVFTEEAYQRRENIWADHLYGLRTETAEDEEAVRELLGYLGADALGNYQVKPYDMEEAKKLVIQFQDVQEDGEAMDRAMLPICCLLLALVEDLEQVDYAYPWGASLRAVAITPEQYDHWAENMGYESIKAQGESTRGIRDLMVYLGWEQPAVAALTAEPVDTEPKVFASVLLQQEVVGRLLEDYEPYDMYLDLDIWEDERVDTLGCYLYYSLTRAQFRQFLSGLEELPEELKDVELEGNEADVAHIAVSGQWSRAEVEAIRADLLARTQVDGQSVSQETETAQSAETQTAFTDVLGYDGVRVRDTEDGSFWNMWTYYAEEHDERFPIAESFGFSDQPQDYVVDLDGDGVTELIANVQYGGDGHEDVYVYRRVGDGPDGIQRGTLDLSDLPNFNNWGANATSAEYDAGAGVFRIRYAQKNTEEYGLLETRGLERFVFSQYEA